MASSSKFKMESGLQLLARLSKKTEITNFLSSLFEPGLKHGDTVELFSNNITTYLIIEVLWEALSPILTNEEPTGVLFVNTAGQFNYEEFVRIAQKRIDNFVARESNQMIHDENIKKDEILTKLLSNMKFLEIYDATQMYTTIHNLDSILSEHSKLSVLIIDTLTAFYWSEQGYKITKMGLYIKKLVQMIQKVSNEHKVILFYTRPEYFGSGKCGDNLEISEVTNGADFRIHLVHSNERYYEANVKTSQKSYKKMLQYY